MEPLTLAIVVGIILAPFFSRPVEATKENINPPKIEEPKQQAAMPLE